MAATKENPIVLYDLADAKGSSWSFNPYKTRLSLNFKGLPYRVEYISFPNVEPRLKELGVSPASDTFPYYTLPVIADPSSDPNGKPTYVSDSFKIAVYLDEKYPSPKYPAIFPSGTQAIQSLLVSQYFSTIAGGLVSSLLRDLPRILDPASAEYFHRTRTAWINANLLSVEETSKRWQEVREKFETIGKPSGPSSGAEQFIMGSQPSFVDFALGGFFHFVERVGGNDSSGLKRMLEWQDGKWGAYWSSIKQIEGSSSQVA